VERAEDLSATVEILENYDCEYASELAQSNFRFADLGERMFSVETHAYRTFKWSEERRFINVLQFRGEDEPTDCFSGKLKEVQQRTQQMLRVLAYSNRHLFASLKLKRREEYKETLESIRWSLKWKKGIGEFVGTIIGGSLGIWLSVRMSEEAGNSSPLWDWHNWVVVASGVAGAKVGGELAEHHLTDYNLLKVARNERLAFALFEEMLVQDAFDGMSYSDLQYLPEHDLFINDSIFKDRKCPITQEPILRAVKVPCCKQLMEERAIHFWLHLESLKNKKPACPLCRKDIKIEELEPQTADNIKFFKALVEHIKHWETFRAFAQAKQGLGLPGIRALPSRDEFLRLKESNRESLNKACESLFAEARELYG
jgi:hypothetical protein